MSRAKQQGTAAESWLVKRLRAAGHADARRLALAGSLDEGDLEATVYGTAVTVEAKARQTLNVQAELGKLRAKTGDRRLPLLVWKRLVPVDGKSVRQPVAGERVVAVLSLEDLLELLDRTYQAGAVAGPAPAPTVSITNPEGELAS